MTRTLPILCTLFFIEACAVRQAASGVPTFPPDPLPVLEGPEDAEAMMHELWQDPSGADETAQAVPLPGGVSAPPGGGPTVFIAEVDSDRLATQLTLARAAVGECGWLLPDCSAAVWHTLARRAAVVGMTLRRMVLKYCSVFRGKHEGRRVWVRGLNADGKRPNGWPESASWSKHAVIWNRMYERAGLFLDGKVKDPCRGKPIHTGGDMDSHRMDPDDWRKVYCGVTHTRTSRQNFWERR